MRVERHTVATAHCWIATLQDKERLLPLRLGLSERRKGTKGRIMRINQITQIKRENDEITDRGQEALA